MSERELRAWRKIVFAMHEAYDDLFDNEVTIIANCLKEKEKKNDK